MLQDFLKSFENTDISKLLLKDLVQLEKTLSFYEATTPLLFYRNKINQEYIKMSDEVFKAIKDLKKFNYESADKASIRLQLIAPKCAINRPIARFF